MQLDDSIVVCTLTDPIEAGFISNILRFEGLTCFLDGIQETSYSNPAGTIRIWVPADDANSAREIIAGFDIVND